jgi:hypothetical protein
LEGFKNDPLFFEGYADAGIGNLEGHDFYCLTKHRMILTPAAHGARYFELYAALDGKFEGVGEQVP